VTSGTGTKHRVPDGSIHKTWNRQNKPVLTIKPGDTVSMSAPDASNGAITPTSTTADMAAVDYRRLDPLMGPIYVDGVMPGDALRIEILELVPAHWGWTALLPSFGLLSGEIRDPYLKIWELEREFIEMPNGSKFTLRPMIGCIGVAPGQDGDYASITPTNSAGNLDCRYLGAGATLIVPVVNEGALLSATDGHAIQGDGEICGTGIECPMEMTFKVDVLRHANLAAPEILIKDTHPYEEGYRIFTGVAPDLMECAKEAVRHCIAPLARSLRVDEIEAYAMTGLIADLRILEIVDVPNWVVGCMLPRRLFE
jgi:acetamidase/formamidase